MDRSLKVKLQVVKLPEENIRPNLYGLEVGKDFLNMTPKA